MTLEHIQTIRTSKGKVYRYLRLPGQPRMKLPDLPIDHPDFLAAYAAASAAAPKKLRAAPGTITALCEAYLRSEMFLAHSENYRALLRRHIDAIRAQAEDAKAAHLRPEDIADDLAVLKPNVAGHRLKAWRQLCAFGADPTVRLLKTDPSKSVIKPKAPKTEGHPPWSAAEIERFRCRWPIGSVPRACFELLYWTGARISDAVRIGPGMVGRDGVLAFRQQKTGDEAFVPWTCALPPYAAAMIEDRDTMHAALACLTGHMTFLATHGGRTRSHKALGTVIADAARTAKIEGRSAHGLRKSRAMRLAEAGATTHQIAAWTGHQSLSEVQHYTEAADRRRAVRGTEQDQNFVKSPVQSVKNRK
ncbi:tyrosine-type recombinase/integrase [Rhodobacter sp. TJ_12]|uniref:tyrosine-type recombinase/integrase n=1 Tax=Rhodobacter sp. TJ_12 TaxID=2029399 RepID=UPI001CBC3381|nr:tyrosine-type recombinase/integrase [Rhodobacter sp. TJ_12]